VVLLHKSRGASDGSRLAAVVEAKAGRRWDRTIYREAVSRNVVTFLLGSIRNVFDGLFSGRRARRLDRAIARPCHGLALSSMCFILPWRVETLFSSVERPEASAVPRRRHEWPSF